MPRQGQSVESCIITTWHKNVGDKVFKGDLLFSYETDKASFEEEAPEDGVLLAVFFDEGDEVPVLVNACVLGNEGEDAEKFRPEGDEPAKAEEKTQEAETQQKIETGQVETSGTAYSPEGTLKISPRAKARARQLGIPARQLSASGPEGRIIERDVMLFAEKMPKVTPLARKKAMEEELFFPEKGSGYGGRVTCRDLVEARQGQVSGDFKVVKLPNIRKIIARKMQESLQNTAQLTLHSSANAQGLLNARKQIKAGKTSLSTEVSLNDILTYILSRLLPDFPDVNAHFMSDHMRVFSSAHIGFAVDTPRGLMVPTLRNADKMSLGELSAEIKRLAGLCQSGSIPPDLLEGASFSLTNLGALGIEMFTPVLNPPQACILGLNTIVNRPEVNQNGQIEAAPYLGLSLTFDHRALDGAPAARFLKAVKDDIEKFDSNKLTQ